MMFKGLYTTLQEKKSATKLLKRLENANEFAIVVGDEKMIFHKDDFVFDDLKEYISICVERVIKDKKDKIDNILGNMKI